MDKKPAVACLQRNQCVAQAQKSKPQCGQKVWGLLFGPGPHGVWLNWLRWRHASADYAHWIQSWPHHSLSCRRHLNVCGLTWRYCSVVLEIGPVNQEANHGFIGHRSTIHLLRIAVGVICALSKRVRKTRCSVMVVLFVSGLTLSRPLFPYGYNYTGLNRNL